MLRAAAFKAGMSLCFEVSLSFLMGMTSCSVPAGSWVFRGVKASEMDELPCCCSASERCQVAPLETEEVAKLAARDALREFSAERAARAPSQIRPCPATLMSDRRPGEGLIGCRVALPGPPCGRIDYAAPCPTGWTVGSDGVCSAPMEYHGYCAGSQFCWLFQLSSRPQFSLGGSGSLGFPCGVTMCCPNLLKISFDAPPL